MSVILETEVNRDIHRLHPLIVPRVDFLVNSLAEARRKKSLVRDLRIFEGNRSLARQAYLYRSGRGTDAGTAATVTQVDAGYSAHNFGLAVDFAAFLSTSRGWTWDVPASDWAVLRAAAVAAGLTVPMPSWDPGHVEAKFWPDIRDTLLDERDRTIL